MRRDGEDGGRWVRSAIEQEGYDRVGRGERLRETVSLLHSTARLVVVVVVVVVAARLVADEQIRVMGGRNIDLG